MYVYAWSGTGKRIYSESLQPTYMELGFLNVTSSASCTIHEAQENDTYIDEAPKIFGN